MSWTGNVTRDALKKPGRRPSHEKCPAPGHFYAQNRSPAHARSNKLRYWFFQCLVERGDVRPEIRGVPDYPGRRVADRTMSARWDSVAGKYDQEKPRIAESVRNAPSIKDQGRQAKDTVASQYGNGTQPPGGSGERYGATRV
jgi:hypothetical protein